MNESVSFQYPPVVETVLGIQFDPLEGLNGANLGAFWAGIKANWPKAKDVQALEDQFEVFGRPAPWPTGLQLRLSNEMKVRLQIRNADEDRMIQVQNCRLDYNWLRKGDAEYPRYRTVRPEFDKALASFRDFLASTGHGVPKPNQWEVTYVNHMPKGTVWNTPDQWGDVFPTLPGVRPPSGMVPLEDFGGHWHFEIPPRRGRLHVEILHGYLESPDGQEVLVMKLTARGPIEKDKDENAQIDQGLNLGHDFIVTSFRDLTSPQAHEFWSRQL